jgi:hypothetical protein
MTDADARDDDLTGEVVWWELRVRDTAAAKAFYGELLGWGFAQLPGYEPEYWVVQGAPGLSGALAPAEPGSEAGGSGSVLYVAVPSLAAAIERAVDLGGDVAMGITAITDADGKFAVVRDPEGNRLGLWGPGDVEDELGPVGGEAARPGGDGG